METCILTRTDASIIYIALIEINVLHGLLLNSEYERTVVVSLNMLSQTFPEGGVCIFLRDVGVCLQNHGSLSLMTVNVIILIVWGFFRN
jgi:hypothetical protein